MAADAFHDVLVHSVKYVLRVLRGSGIMLDRVESPAGSVDEQGDFGEGVVRVVVVEEM